LTPEETLGRSLRSRIPNREDPRARAEEKGALFMSDLMEESSYHHPKGIRTTILHPQESNGRGEKKRVKEQMCIFMEHTNTERIHHVERGEERGKEARGKSQSTLLGKKKETRGL